MNTRNYKRSELHGLLLKWRWIIMSLVGFLGASIEIIERINEQNLQIDNDFMTSIMVEGVLIPVLGVLLLEFFQKTSIKQIQAINHLSQKEALSHLIVTAPNWNELIRVIVEFPSTFIPLSGSALFLYNSLDNRYSNIGLWGFYSIRSPVTFIQAPDEVCPACQESRAKPFLYLCLCKMNQDTGQPLKQYGLPLILSKIPVGLLYLFLPEDMPLSEDQEFLLNSVGPEMTLALENARNKQINQDLKHTTDGEKRKLARDLHDNMAQNLIYVRQKLYEFSENKTITSNEQLNRDIIQIHNVVDEIYIDLREMLRKLESNLEIDLETLLSDYIHTLNGRMSYEVQYSTVGISRPVPNGIAHQVLYIAGELFANIEKHAMAKHVLVTLEWQEASLVLSICDDGRGFDPLAVSPDGHFGLSIIRERAEEIKGRLNIQTSPGNGTEVTLWLPVGSYS